ncbi:MAG TPA: hypothetical protein VG253_23395 [Streptosporangiaceae bacterium]|nr:hypothetical protein [Streptosporangiaceae bacterium]
MIGLAVVVLIAVVIVAYAADRILKARKQAKHLHMMSERLSAAASRSEAEQAGRDRVAAASVELTSVMPAIGRPPLSIPGVPSLTPHGPDAAETGESDAAKPEAGQAEEDGSEADLAKPEGPEADGKHLPDAGHTGNHPGHPVRLGDHAVRAGDHQTRAGEHPGRTGRPADHPGRGGHTGDHPVRAGHSGHTGEHQVAAGS